VTLRLGVIHAMGMIPRFHRAVCGLRPIGTPSECFRMTARVKSGKAQNERMFFRFAPEIVHPICASTSTNYLSIGFAKRLRGRGPQQGATLGADHLIWGGPQRNSHAADVSIGDTLRQKNVEISTNGSICSESRWAFARDTRSSGAI